MMSKDESIVSQVAAKIAADLIPSSNDLNESLSDWATAYHFIKDALFGDMGFGTSSPAATASAPASYTVDQAVASLEQSMGAVATTTVRVKGDQHGPLPDWLFGEAARAGVTEVYDNRNSLAENPKRPWFRGTGGKDAPAFWPPKGR